jgi:F0F1-type ATP synthase epsilon subunit
VAWASNFKIRLLIPEAVRYEAEGVKSAVIPLGDGFMGILPNHANFMGKIGMGPAFVRLAEGEKVFMVRGGWVHIRDNVVELAASEVIDTKLSDEKIAELKRQVAALEGKTVEEVEKKRVEGTWIKLLEQYQG